jgi:hypothetical protein
MPSNRVLRRLWRPPAETLEALGSVLGAHWRAASRSRAARLFSPTRPSWLRERATIGSPVWITTSPRAEGSSGRRQDPRRY